MPVVAGSYRARDQLVAQWLANGRRSPGAAPPPPLRVKGLVARYWKYAKGYYVKNGEPTGQLTVIKVALRRLCEIFAELPASELTPIALEQLQEAMIPEDLA